LRKKIEQRMKKQMTDLSPILLGVLVLSSSLFLGAVAVLRASNPQSLTIGMDVSVTICYALGLASYFATLHIFAFSFLQLSYVRLGRFNKTAGKNGPQTVRRLAFVLAASAASSALVLFVSAVIMPYSSGPTMLYALTAVHFVGMASIILITGMIMIPRFTRKIIHELEEVLASLESGTASGEQLQFVLKRMTRFQNCLQGICLFGVPCASLLG
jgi:hypothetical protein